MAEPRVFTIPAGAPFLPTLADQLLAGRIVPIEDARADPLALANVTILLPTRRSVRALGEVLVGRLGGAAAILPAIRPIGDVDEEDHLLNPAVETGADRLVLPQAISGLSRRLALTRLTLAWRRAVRRELLAIDPDEEMMIPASAADAARLAGDLARLMDDMEIAGVSWDAIGKLAPEDHAGYFQITLDFLKIVTEHWPAFLAERGVTDPVARRDRLIRAEAQRLEALGAPGPLIAAGSTGSIPATADLLRVIARLSNGAVVLPGLDQGLDDAGWAAIGDAESEAAAFSHPQFGLKQLVAAIGIPRQEVKRLGWPGRALRARTTILAEALRPAETTDSWAQFEAVTLRPRAVGVALAGVDLVVARHEQEEGLAIAIAIRDALEAGARTIALVTPDRTLAGRVAVELNRWHLTIDDSAGEPLGRTAAGVFARLLVEAVSSDADPLKLLALLKHPLAAFGMQRGECRRAARFLELALFRGWRVTGGVIALRAALARARASVSEKGTTHVPAARRRMPEWQWELAATLVQNLAELLGSLEATLKASDVSVATVSGALGEVLAAATGEAEGDDRLWSAPDGEALAELLEGLAGDEGEALRINPSQYADLFATLMGEVLVQRPVGADPRIHIWGTLEARLQSVEVLILAGLDEGVWPAGTRTDPWLSRAMRAELGLPPPERRIGLAAHDFAQAMAAPRVILTRAAKRKGAPTVPSRWLQRLLALLGEDEAGAIETRGDRFVTIARDIDRVAATRVTPVRRPEPRPPLAARPRSLSITDIENLVRDPYAIYAKRILRLEELDPIGRVPDYALRGTLMHAALGRFSEEWSAGFDDVAIARLREMGQAALREVANFPDVHALWSLRFDAIARWFIAWEAGRTDDVASRHAEVPGELPLDAPGGTFTLKGRADRIDVLHDGSFAVFDFKTGTVPTARQVVTGMSPQLGLEAAMARRGAFRDLPGRPVSELAWIGLSRAARDAYDAVRNACVEGTPDELGDRVLVEFHALIAAFDEADHAYASRTRPMFEQRYESPYDHLARVREWTLVESEEDVFWAVGGPVRP